jgi:FMN-dependent oxidoreductase (nitrilotriacetate monooxygenase family)
VAALTSKIGVVATFSTTFTEPFNVARQMCSLDHLSGGRAGWNMVTSFDGALHYSDAPLPDHARRYERAKEYAQVIEMLFDSWEPDALIIDRKAGLYADPTKIHCDTFEGKVFRVKGPLNMARPPQGRPVILQAGQSDTGKDFAARHADAVYALGPTLELAQAHYADLKSRMAKFGRQKDELKVMTGCVPIVGETEADAEYMRRQLADLIDFKVARALLQQRLVGIDLSQYDDNEVIPASAFAAAESSQAAQSHFAIYKNWSVEKKYSIRRIIEIRGIGQGHWAPFGSAEKIADEMQERFLGKACDGFNMSPLYQIGGTERIAKLLVPALQAKGYYRTEYQGDTLRENLGIPIPTRARLSKVS